MNPNRSQESNNSLKHHTEIFMEHIYLHEEPGLDNLVIYLLDILAVTC